MKPRQTSKRANGQCGPKQPAHHIPGKIHTDTHTQTHTHTNTPCANRKTSKNISSAPTAKINTDTDTHTHRSCLLFRPGQPPSRQQQQQQNSSKNNAFTCQTLSFNLEALNPEPSPLIHSWCREVTDKEPSLPLQSQQCG